MNWISRTSNWKCTHQPGVHINCVHTMSTFFEQCAKFFFKRHSSAWFNKKLEIFSFHSNRIFYMATLYETVKEWLISLKNRKKNNFSAEQAIFGQFHSKFPCRIFRLAEFCFPDFSLNQAEECRKTDSFIQNLMKKKLDFRCTAQKCAHCAYKIDMYSSYRLKCAFSV